MYIPVTSPCYVGQLLRLSHIGPIHMYFIRPLYHCSQYPLPALGKTLNTHFSISLYFSFESRLVLNRTPVIYQEN